MFNVHVRVDQPAQYIIKVQGRLSGDLSDWFCGPVSTATETGEQGEPITALTGTVADQAALHGLLQQIRDRGLTLLYIDCLSARSGAG